MSDLRMTEDGAKKILVGQSYFIRGTLTGRKRGGWVGKNAKGMTTIVKSVKDAIKFQMVSDTDIDALTDKIAENSNLGHFEPCNTVYALQPKITAVELSF